MGAYAQAVRYYTKASTLLDQYQHVQSFAGIRRDCEKIIRDLSRTLQERLHEPQVGITWSKPIGLTSVHIGSEVQKGGGYRRSQMEVAQK